MKRFYLLFLISLPGLFFGLALAQDDRPVTWSEPANAAGDVNIMLMGDINIQNRVDPASGFEYIKATLAQADIRFCNLEGAFAGTSTDPNLYDIPHKPSWTHSDPAMVEGLKAVSMDVVGVANNVTFPFTALMRSIEVLKKAGIKYTGGGANIPEAIKPVVIEKNGTKVGFVQYACTVFPYDHAAQIDRPGIAQVKVTTSYQPPVNLDKPGQPAYVKTHLDQESITAMRNNIAALRKQVDVVIVSYHWGVSSMYAPDPYQQQVAHAAIESGADVVFGHGAHKLQKIEMFQEKPIFYCVGQGVFDWWKVRTSLNGLLVRVLVRNKKVHQIAAVPMQRDEDNAPVIFSPSDPGPGMTMFARLNQNLDANRARLKIKGQEIEIFHRDRQEPLPSLAQQWEISGFMKPECVVYDEKHDLLYVGNMNQSKSDGYAQEDGFISKVNLKGEIEKLKWITGLVDPKGMDIYDDVLWVNDVDRVCKIDISTGKILKKYSVPNVVFLNDLSVSPSGEVFVTDADGHQVFRLRDERFQLYWRELEKGRPNGILAEEDRLLIATTNSHKLLHVDRATRKPRLLIDNIGRGDGIEALGNGDYFISDYRGRIFYFSPDELLHLLIDRMEEHKTADFDYIPSQNLLLVPTHTDNSVMAFKVRWEETYSAKQKLDE